MPSEEYDTASLIKPREFEIQMLIEWIAQVGEERARSKTETFPNVPLLIYRLNAKKIFDGGAPPRPPPPARNTTTLAAVGRGPNT